MKKIDFHMHTISTPSDKPFDFCIDTLKSYVATMQLDCIAITNHNMFDLGQFETIRDSLGITVLPGIEIDLEGCHLLLIDEGKELLDFTNKCLEINRSIPTCNDQISFEELKEIFPDLSKYLLIPHYQKNPDISVETLNKFGDLIFAGEVTSIKKFMYCLKDEEALVPVCFSDLRIHNGLPNFPSRQTYLDIGELSLAGIKRCLRDKNKVFLSKEEGHRFFEVLDGKLRLSTGLNVILGERSTGKSYTLDEIFQQNEYENVKYIRQFSLLEKEDEEDKRKFEAIISDQRSLFTKSYLAEFQSVVDDMEGIDIARSEQQIEKYIESLVKHANESQKIDNFAKAVLFVENKFKEGDSNGLKSLINSVKTLIENKTYRGIIDNHVDIQSLKNLAVELMIKYGVEQSERLKKRFVNQIIQTIKNELNIRTAANPVEEIDLYQIATDRERKVKFAKVVRLLQTDRELERRDTQGYQVVATRKRFTRTQELKDLSGKRDISFSAAFENYSDPYVYLMSLRKIGVLRESDYYKYFARLEYKIVNKYGVPVSGGERSEYRLLYEISDAQQYDMLLIDEPESSFDNLFLLKKVNQLIKDISKCMPVVIVTHNSTVGASIEPDYVIYTAKKIVDGSPCYEIYAGHPTDKMLSSHDGNKISNHQVLLNCLEAGEMPYCERGEGYEVLKN